MAFLHQISITADSGVGSTTTAKYLHRLLGISPWRWVNAGAIMRIFAHEKNLSIEEFAQYNVEHPREEFDNRCDSMIEKFGEHDYVIFEGRLVHHFAPHAFHVRLVCDPHVRALRRAKDMLDHTVDEVYQKIIDRDVLNHDRYIRVYGPHVLWKNSQFDLVLDTGIHTPEQIAHMIVESQSEWKMSKNI